MVIDLDVVHDHFASNSVTNLILSVLVRRELALFVRSNVLLRTPYGRERVFAGRRTSIEVTLVSFSVDYVLDDGRLVEVGRHGAILRN